MQTVMHLDTAAEFRPRLLDAAERPEALRRRSERRRQRRLEQEIRDALRGEVLALHYQPLLDLATGAPTGAEALLCWPHRGGGSIAPNAFLPVAEQSALIVEIGAWALSHACREAACWHDRDLRVSVNVAARQLAEGTLPRQVAAALAGSGLAAERLELELPEEILLDVDTDTLLALAALRDLGVGLSLKEFGHRYGSLSALRRLPLTALKLDRSLVRSLPDDREEAAIIGAAVTAARTLGLTIIAEGVETEDQRAFLSGIGCDLGQGFLFSAALPADRFRARFAGHKEVTED